MAIKIGDIAREERQDTAANWTSNNPVPRSGEWCLETDTGKGKWGDGATTWNALEHTIDGLPVTYNISAADTVIALPNITGKVQKRSYFWTCGDGSNTFSFTVSDAATINGDLATVWKGEGDGHIEIESDGSNWRVKAYADYLEFNNVSDNQYIWKYIDGSEKQLIEKSYTTNIGTASGGLFVSDIQSAVTRSKNFTEQPSEHIYFKGNGSGLSFPTKSANTTNALTCTFNIADTVSNTGLTWVVAFEATGKWK